jgi:hypothetical protein
MGAPRPGRLGVDLIDTLTMTSGRGRRHAKPGAPLKGPREVEIAVPDSDGFKEAQMRLASGPN